MDLAIASDKPEDLEQHVIEVRAGHCLHMSLVLMGISFNLSCPNMVTARQLSVELGDLSTVWHSHTTQDVGHATPH